MSNKRSIGFTLIELLISIVIIGLLASMVVISMGAARKSARDARRKSDLHLVAATTEQYRLIKKVFPPDSSGDYTGDDDDKGNYASAASFMKALVDERLLSRVANDPQFNDFVAQAPNVRFYHSYSYRTTYDVQTACFGSQILPIFNLTGIANPVGKGYMLMAWLENTDDPDGPKALTGVQNETDCSLQAWGGKVWRGSEGGFQYVANGSYLLFPIAR